jgi:hypothetical protein
MIQSIEALRGPRERPAGPPEVEPSERLVRRLAADHLRDLRDDA